MFGGNENTSIEKLAEPNERAFDAIWILDICWETKPNCRPFFSVHINSFPFFSFAIFVCQFIFWVNRQQWAMRNAQMNNSNGQNIMIPFAICPMQQPHSNTLKIGPIDREPKWNVFLLCIGRFLCPAHTHTHAVTTKFPTNCSTSPTRTPSRTLCAARSQ